MLAESKNMIKNYILPPLLGNFKTFHETMTQVVCQIYKWWKFGKKESLSRKVRKAEESASLGSQFDLVVFLWVGHG